MSCTWPRSWAVFTCILALCCKYCIEVHFVAVSAVFAIFAQISNMWSWLTQLCVLRLREWNCNYNTDAGDDKMSVFKASKRHCSSNSRFLFNLKNFGASLCHYQRIKDLTAVRRRQRDAFPATGIPVCAQSSHFLFCCCVHFFLFCCLCYCCLRCWHWEPSAFPAKKYQFVHNSFSLSSYTFTFMTAVRRRQTDAFPATRIYTNLCPIWWNPQQKFPLPPFTYGAFLKYTRRSKFHQLAKSPLKAPFCGGWILHLCWGILWKSRIWGANMS